MKKGDFLAVYVIWLREIKKFWREKPRVVTSIIQPVLWLFIMGIGIGSAFNRGGSGIDYVQFIFPGIISMAVLFSATNSGLSVVWDREFGFLKEILVSPVSRTAIVMGKVLAGSSTAVIQGMIVFLFAPFIGISLKVSAFFYTFAAMFLLAVALAAIGILLGTKIDSFHSFPLVSNFIILPMFFLSGAMFPLSDAPPWMLIASRINPLAYGVDLLHAAINGTGEFAILLNIAVLSGVAAVMLISSACLFNRPE